MDRRSWILPVAIALAAAAVILVSFLRRSPPPEPPAEVVSMSAEEISVAPPPEPPAPPPVPRPPPPPKPDDPLMAMWREAVVYKQRDMVGQAISSFQSREEQYREPLMKMAGEDVEPRVRAFCVSTLGLFRNPPPEEFFIGRLDDPHEYPRKAALEALAKRGSAACLPAVRKIQESDPSEEVRGAAGRTVKVFQPK